MQKRGNKQRAAACALACLIALVGSVAACSTQPTNSQDVTPTPTMTEPSEQTPDEADETTSKNLQGPFRVTKVADGDTISVSINGKVTSVRMIGIDTPETQRPGTPVQCFGPQASAYSHKLDGWAVGFA